MFGSFGWMELLLILIIVLIIFGAGKIPQLGEGLGKAIKGFKRSMSEADAMDVTPGGEESPHVGQQPHLPPTGTTAPTTQNASQGAQVSSGYPAGAPIPAEVPKHG